jgi:hypothetical protein
MLIGFDAATMIHQQVKNRWLRHLSHQVVFMNLNCREVRIQMVQIWKLGQCQMTASLTQPFWDFFPFSVPAQVQNAAHRIFVLI